MSGNVGIGVPNPTAKLEVAGTIRLPPTGTAKSFAATLREGGFSLSAPYDATLNTHLKALKGLTATSTFILGPQGSTAGQERITGECRMKSLKRSGEVSGLLMIEVEFLFDGTVTEDTF